MDLLIVIMLGMILVVVLLAVVLLVVVLLGMNMILLVVMLLFMMQSLYGVAGHDVELLWHCWSWCCCRDYELLKCLCSQCYWS